MKIKPITFRKLAKKMAEIAHYILLQQHNGEPLDGDQTEELSMMFQEELDILNANT